MTEPVELHHKPTARDLWVRKEERKRDIASWGMALLFYALLAGALWVSGLFRIENLSDYSGPVTVRLGSPEGKETVSDLPPQSAATPPVVPAPLPAVPAAPAAPRQAAPAAGTTAMPPAAEQRQSSSPHAVPVPEQTARDSEFTPWAAQRQAAGSATQAATAETAGVGENPLGGPVVLKGSEHGNAYETNFESGSGHIGRGLYVPIYLYMPLPRSVPADLINRIPASNTGLRSAERRKQDFRMAYESAGGAWRLKAQPVLPDRPDLWKILEDSGYPVRRADFKEGASLSPVTLLFRVSPSGRNKTPVLESVELVTSSGNAEIDQCVLYGFRQAAFNNDSDRSISGRFTYRFGD